jgi:4-hydroxybenzoate polyprenyltransferase
MANQTLIHPQKSNSILAYIQIARIDHWFKNVFMIPGIILAIFDSPGILSWNMLPSLFLGVLATCIVASGNYVINEIIDAPKDRLHPVKKTRPIPSGKVNLKIAYIEWIILVIGGLSLAYMVNVQFFWSALSLFIMGIVYNVPPVRSKDLPYVDVLTESVNNPIRLYLGWYATGNIHYPPPISLVLAYWMIGAFFMAVKRFAEFRRIADREVAAKYRNSFRYYSETKLLLSIIYYGTAFGLFGGIFLIRYRIELILSVPFLAGLIAAYMRLGFLEDSPAQYPERLYKQKWFVGYTTLCFLIVFSLLFVDVPFIHILFAPKHLPGQ